MAGAGRITTAIAAVAAAIALCATSAQAAIVTVGSPLTRFAAPQFLGCITVSCTFSQSALPGATLTSPSDGAVVSWRIIGGSPSRAYRLQVLSFVRDVGTLEKEFESVQSSAGMRPLGSGLETFSTSLPIKAGQPLGLATEPEADIGFVPTPAARVMSFAPALADGAPQIGSIGILNQEVAFNADIQPAPTIASVSPASGPAGGGNSIIISGTDFEGASAVRFGSAPATSYSISSESQITAVAPPMGGSKQVPISVTTLAGTAVSTGQYGYEEAGGTKHEEPPVNRQSCLVPSLEGKKLKASKRALSAALCAIGTVRKKRARLRKHGRVIAQRPGPGQLVPVGTKVNLTLGR